MVTGCFEKFPPYQSFFLFGDSENGFYLYSSISSLSVDMISQEGYRLVPVGNSGLLHAEFSANSCSLILDFVLNVDGLFFNAIDQYYKVIGVPDIPSFRLMPSIIDGYVTSFPFQF